GTATGDAAVCHGFNDGTVRLGGYTGSVVRWETSQTGKAPWAAINHTLDELSYENLVSTAYYRAIVTNGVCPEAVSNAVSITVDALTVAGDIAGTDELCAGTGAATLRLTGKTGDIVRWEASNDGSTWMTIAGETDPQLK